MECQAALAAMPLFQDKITQALHSQKKNACQGKYCQDNTMTHENCNSQNFAKNYPWNSDSLSNWILDKKQIEIKKIVSYHKQVCSTIQLALNRWKKYW